MKGAQFEGASKFDISKNGNGYTIKVSGKKVTINIYLYDDVLNKVTVTKNGITVTTDDKDAFNLSESAFPFLTFKKVNSDGSEIDQKKEKEKQKRLEQQKIIESLSKYKILIENEKEVVDVFGEKKKIIENSISDFTIGDIIENTNIFYTERYFEYKKGLYFDLETKKELSGYTISGNIDLKKLNNSDELSVLMESASDTTSLKCDEVMNTCTIDPVSSFVGYKLNYEIEKKLAEILELELFLIKILYLFKIYYINLINIICQM